MNCNTNDIILQSHRAVGTATQFSVDSGEMFQYLIHHDILHEPKVSVGYIIGRQDLRSVWGSLMVVHWAEPEILYHQIITTILLSMLAAVVAVDKNYAILFPPTTN
ncbi:hypothetical protein T4D_13619 [Trichinella pseudospiralis]|uniref:Uncharacterized protein n=1 Tax=Trichinella pseudospiralis TaxID=6337 RepID=A0A0V1FDW5_TRIPS|nr:hypothetical protein T4D_13619 [Trichinella pseudospiralis]